MNCTTIRVRRSTHALIRKLADEGGMSPAEVVEQAVLDSWRRHFWSGYHTAYAAIQADSTAAATHQREPIAWESTVADGLDDRGTTCQNSV